MADIFISYAREDRVIAEQIARGLQAMGLQVFWDTEIPPGHTWADYIEAKLGQCRAVIVLWSQHSVSSQWVREEARMGRETKRLIPAQLDGTPPPFGFGEVQAANLSGWTGDSNHPEWVRFSQAAYNRVREGGPAPAPQPVGAPPPAAPPQWSQPQPAYSAPAGAAAAASAAPAASPIEYVAKCFRLYIDGRGRARRAEYWWWVLFSVVVGFVASLIDLSFGINPYTSQPNSQVVNMLASLALLAPGVSLQSRRLHDIGASGWWTAAFYGAAVFGYILVFAAIPSGNSGLAAMGGLLFIGVLVGWLIVGVMPGQKGQNRYGPDPKA
jgi:uncharacterized membrane protein YhaH (DUF805 family)